METNERTGTTDERLAFELRELFARINYETVVPRSPGHFRLDRMRRLLHELGDPQDRCRIVHVAGTKGKGSVCQMIASSLTACGIRTGRYSSPHIEQLHERIEIDHRRIDDTSLANVLQTVRETADRSIAKRSNSAKRMQDRQRHSFFEIITAAALVYYATAGAELVVLEVGLGGRLDSTNVCQPELCVITTISLDHMKQLGSVVEKIAREKAGIIKSGVPVVSSAIDPAAAREVRDTCAVHDCQLLELNRDFFCEITARDRQRLQLEFRCTGKMPASLRGNRLLEPCDWQWENVRLNAIGDHQADNAALAIAALQELARTEPRITEQPIRQALASWSLPGRCEIISRHPLIVVDMSHNVASVAALVATLQQLVAWCKPKRRTLVFASSQDKDVTGMLRTILGEFDHVMLTRFTLNPRAADPGELRAIAESLRPSGSSDHRAFPQLSTVEDPSQAWKEAINRTQPDDLLCVAGSAFLVSELRPGAIAFRDRERAKSASAPLATDVN